MSQNTEAVRKILKHKELCTYTPGPAGLFQLSQVNERETSILAQGIGKPSFFFPSYFQPAQKFIRITKPSFRLTKFTSAMFAFYLVHCELTGAFLLIWVVTLKTQFEVTTLSLQPDGRMDGTERELCFHLTYKASRVSL